MKEESLSLTIQRSQPEQDVATHWRRVIGRRSFLHGVGAAGAVLPAGRLLAQDDNSNKKLSKGDAAILKFLAAAEIIESDLWQQYNELGGANGGNPSYIQALRNLDNDMPQYITDNTDDELSHAAFLNAYLTSKGEQPVSLEAFRRLPSSKATGARNIRRLTNLMRLDVDTRWWTRYRSMQNPDLGATFPQAVNIQNQPAIPLDDTDTPPSGALTAKQTQRIQAIANTASFHFAFIEQGGSSLYSTLCLQVSDVEVLRIVVSIGGVEVDHFSLWHDKAGNAVSAPLAPLTDPETGVTFPVFPQSEDLQPNKILPEPCAFLRPELGPCSVIRPTSTQNSGAVAAVNAFAGDLLFQGQQQDFFEALMDLATAADAAKRGGN
jgi:Ferritin-like domain